ncbi:MAG: hypothetical protein AABZ06_02405 [Bdellovibrionota bacterium]
MQTREDKERWFVEGFDDFESVILNERHRSPTRVWAKAGYEKEVIFVDDGGFSIWEHSYVVNGDSRNWITCLEGTGSTCPFCERRIKKYFQTFYTIIQTSGHWGENEIWYQNKRRLFCAQPDVARIIQKHKGRLENTLIGRKFRVGRLDYSSEATERCFEYVERVQLDKYNNPHPFEYRSLFVPKSASELEDLLATKDGKQTGKQLLTLSACFEEK